jgi:hypothetical protein
MDISDLLSITLKKKIENKGSQIRHTKKNKKIIVLFCFPELTPLSIAKLNCHLISSRVLVSALTVRADSFNESGKRKKMKLSNPGNGILIHFAFTVEILSDLVRWSGKKGLVSFIFESYHKSENLKT